MYNAYIEKMYEKGVISKGTFKNRWMNILLNISIHTNTKTEM